MEAHPRAFAVRVREVFSPRRRLLFAGALVAGVFLLFFFATNHPPRQASKSVPVALDPGSLNTPIPSSGLGALGGDTKELSAFTPLRALPESYRAGQVDSANSFREPRIAYSAELSEVTREFAHSRASLEEILDRHRGYVAKLRMVGQPSGSVLSATLRVPSSEYRAALTELKAVGLVEHEEEAADEIAQQHSELEARLVNAQNEEQRLQKLLQNRRDQFGDLGSLERQVVTLRGEIERIEAERLAFGSRTSFANVFFSLREERTSPAETVGAKLRNAAVSGWNDAFESISTILLFLASRGPLLALWAALLYFPARFFWRRRSQLAFTEVESPKIP
jgi:hypothetical protein